LASRSRTRSTVASDKRNAAISSAEGAREKKSAISSVGLVSDA